MTSDIMRNILACTNRKLKLECRNALSFLANAPCHPSYLSFSIIKVISLPKNATSLLQPLDSGIIQNFKVKYKKLLLEFMISRVDKQTTAAEIAKDVDILKAIRWMQEARVSVSEYTIRKSGFTDETFAEVDTNDKEFASFINEINFEVSPEEVIAIDNAVPCYMTNNLSQVHAISGNLSHLEMQTRQGYCHASKYIHSQLKTVVENAKSLQMLKAALQKRYIAYSL